MSDDQKPGDQSDEDNMKSDPVAQVNEPDDARAKQNPRAGNIVGGV